jgi:hypothetical protein
VAFHESAKTGLVSDQVVERQWVCARRLRERRRQLFLTQNEIVRRLSHRGVNLTNRTLSAMENGRGLDVGRLPDLAAVLDCSVTYLLGLTAEPLRWEPDEPLATEPGHPVSARRNWILGPGPPLGAP